MHNFALCKFIYLLFLNSVASISSINSLASIYRVFFKITAGKLIIAVSVVCGIIVFVYRLYLLKIIDQRVKNTVDGKE